jgi:hypothetical protein
MASLVLSGDTSGSITVSAPAVAGSTTQTLVNVTGTLAPIVSGTAVASTSGTSVDFTGIPSWVKRITVMLNGLSYAAAGAGVVQIGSGSLSTSGYTSNIVSLTASNTNIAAQTNGFGAIATSASGATINGVYTLFLVTGNTWAFTEMAFRTTDNAGINGNGFIALSGVLDRLSVVATSSSFDAGTINILYE